MKRGNILSFSKFCIVGCINTVSSLLVYYLLLAMNCNYLVSIAVGYIVSSIVGYILNKTWVFNQKSIKINKSIFKYYILYGSALLLNLLCMAILVSMFRVSNIIAPIITIIITTIYNYVLSKNWVFNKKNSTLNYELAKKDKGFIFLAVIFLILAFFMFDNNRYIHPVADDYTNINSLMETIPENSRDNYSTIILTKAIIKRSLITYEEWQGTYSANILFFIHPLLVSNNAYRITMIILQLFWLLGTYYFFCSLPTKNHTERIRNIKLYLLFIIFSILSMFSLGEGIYWFTGAILYIVPFTLSLIFLGLLLRNYRKPNKLTRFLCFIITIIIAGTNYTTCLVVGAILLFIAIYYLINKSTSKWFYLSLLIVFCVAFAFNVFCPGNFIRISEFEKLPFIDTLRISGVNSFEMIKHLLFNTLFVPFIIAAIPSLISLSQSIHIKKNLFTILILFCSSCFISTFIPMAFSYGTEYQETRVQNLQLFYLALAIAFLIAVYLKTIRTEKLTKHKSIIISSSIILSIVMIAAIGTDRIAGFQLIDDITHNRSLKYHLCMSRIEDQLLSPDDKEVVLENCEYYPPSQHHYYLVNGQWQIKEMEKFYNKSIVIKE